MTRTKKLPKKIQMDIWGNLIRETKAPRPAAFLDLSFEGSPARAVVIAGEPWWVLADVARILQYRDAEKAARLVRAKHKGTLQSGTPGLQPGMVIISEPGLYRLVMRSNKPEAERFQDWVFEEVLPSIRKTGTYTMPAQKRCVEETTAKRLGCDIKTARARIEQSNENRKLNTGLEAKGAKPTHHRANFNAVHKGVCDGQTARDLRHVLKVKDTPLNHMGYVPLAINSHTKAIAAKYIEEHGVSLERQPEIYERFAREMKEADMRRLGPGHMIGITEDPRRGRIIDVVRGQLALSN